MAQKKFFFLIFCGIFFFSISSHAQENFFSRSDTISINSFLRAVVAAHPQMISAGFEQDIAEAELRNALGGFDPALKGKYEFKSKSDKEKVNFLDAGIELPVETLFGPRVSAGVRRGEGTNINPENSTDGNEYNIGVTMQLLQGITTDRRRATLDKARLRPELASANLDFEKNFLLRSAALKYWDWAEAHTQAKISGEILSVSLERAIAIGRRARAGEIAPVDSIEALQEVERRRGEYLRALRNLEQAELESIAFIWQKENSQMQKITASPRLLSIPRPDEEKISSDKNFALRNRPELRRLEFSREIAEIDLALNSEMLWPNVEMQALGIYSPELRSSSDYKIGLNVSHPLFFRSASAQQDLTKISLERIQLQRAVMERNIFVEIDNAALSANRAQERIQAAEREVNLAKLMLEAEQKKFFAGESTLLFVNLRERAYAEAQTRLVSAQADYLRAMTQYQFATGKISPEGW